MRGRSFVTTVLVLLPVVASSAPSRLTVESRAGEVLARDDHGTLIFRDPDPAIVIQSAVNAMARTGGTISLSSGVYRFRSVVFLPPGNAHSIKIVGNENVTLELSPSAPTAFRFRPTADHQDFRRYSLESFSVDANNAGGREGGVILSTGNTGARLRVTNVSVRNVRAWNIPTDPDVSRNHRGGIELVTHQQENDEPVSDWIRDVVVENVTVRGGNWGVVIVGTGGVEPPSLNVSVDNITLRHCVHEQYITGLGFPSTNFHIGSHGRVGKVVLEDLAGYNAGDNCVEVNNATHLDARRVYCQDPFNVGWTIINYSVRADSRAQRYRIEDSEVRLTQGFPRGGHGTGWGIWGQQPSRSVGDIRLEGCRYVNESATFGHPVHTLAEAPGAWRRLVLRQFVVREQHVVADAADPSYLFGIYLLAGMSPAGSVVIADGLDVAITVTRIGTGRVFVVPLIIGGGSQALAMRNAKIAVGLRGGTGDAWSAGIWLGADKPTSMSAVIDGYTWVLTEGAGERAAALRVDDRETLSLRSPLVIRNADFRSVSAIAEDIAWGPAQDNRSALRASGIRSNRSGVMAPEPRRP